MCRGWCRVADRSGLSGRLKTVSRPRPQLGPSGWEPVHYGAIGGPEIFMLIKKLNISTTYIS